MVLTCYMKDQIHRQYAPDFSLLLIATGLTVTHKENKDTIKWEMVLKRCGNLFLAINGQIPKQ